MIVKNELSSIEIDALLNLLKVRFENNMHRHQHLEWNSIQQKLKMKPNKLWSLYSMEKTGGEPDVIDYDQHKDEYHFYDCSVESPKGRRSLCYDNEALQMREKNKPENSAVEMAIVMGVELLTEKQYRRLQQFGNFDSKTSSWVKTPTDIRKLDGAIFCDYRYEHVFTYHNGAQSYYSSRGFRGVLKV